MIINEPLEGTNFGFAYGGPNDFEDYFPGGGFCDMPVDNSSVIGLPGNPEWNLLGDFEISSIGQADSGLCDGEFENIEGSFSGLVWAKTLCQGCDGYDEYTTPVQIELSFSVPRQS